MSVVIVIVDYGVGNLGSIANMLKKAGAAATISSSPDVVARAEKLILPGVGAFDAGMENLAARGLIDVLNQRVLDAGVPILGLCLGMQLLSRRSDEGVRPGLGWIDAVTRKFELKDRGLKVPHMGWNQIRFARSTPLVDGLPPNCRFYFVHSYYLECENPDAVVGWTNYGHDFGSIVAQRNIMGVQFHPEKSHRFGLALLKQFAERC